MIAKVLSKSKRNIHFPVIEGGEGGGSLLVTPPPPELDSVSSVASWHCCRFRNLPRLNFVLSALKKERYSFMSQK